MSKLQNNSDKNEGTLPFRLPIPNMKYALEYHKEGKQVVKMIAGMYELVGFTRGKNHAKLLRITVPDGDDNPNNDFDILPHLEMADAGEKVDEYEEIAVRKVNTLYWDTEENLSEENLSIVK